jgi:beta-alanine degradation protein BauB
MRRWTVVLSVSAAMLTATAAISFQNPARRHPLDPLTVAAKFTTPLMENERVRVLAIQVRPGETVPFHKVMRSVLVAQEGGKARFRQPDGTTQDFTFPSEPAGGQPIPEPSVVWDDPVTYSIENRGDTTMRLIRVEIK